MLGLGTGGLDDVPADEGVEPGSLERRLIPRPGPPDADNRRPSYPIVRRLLGHRARIVVLVYVDDAGRTFAARVIKKSYFGPRNDAALERANQESSTPSRGWSATGASSRRASGPETGFRPS